MFVTSTYLLRPLRTTDVRLDYEAVMASRTMLRLNGGGSWPADDFTLADNLADLSMHEQEHRDKVAFTFTMLNLAQSHCLGCVYVNPLAQMSNLAGVTDEIPVTVDEQQAVVRFWVRESSLGDDLDWRLLQTLMRWFKEEWRFSAVYFRANARDERQMRILERADLRQSLFFDVPGRRGPFVAYGPLGKAKESDAR